jgi:hypothetical protein
VGAFSQPNLGVFPVRLVGQANVLPNDPTATCLDPTTQTGDYVCMFNGPIFGPNPGAGQVSVYSIRSDLKTPRYHNFNLSFQQDVTHNNVLTIAYAGQRGQKPAHPL